MTFDARAPVGDERILALRGPKNRLDPMRAYGSFVEPERDPAGHIVDVATILLTNRECPFRCVMCDLWENTLDETVPRGAVPAQIRHALESLPPARQIKLYNAGSFFDPGAIPVDDWQEIARLLAPYERVIVEAHPKMIGRRCFEFAELLRGKLEVAIGLETVDPHVLPLLNKQMTLHDFDQAVHRLRDRDIDTRAFILIRTPFQSDAEGNLWARRSVDHAFATGIQCCTLIPTRAGNGLMDEWEKEGHFAPPTLDNLLDVFTYAVGHGGGRAFLDTWDLERFLDCPNCRQEKLHRINEMNLRQTVDVNLSAACDACAGTE